MTPRLKKGYYERKEYANYVHAPQRKHFISFTSSRIENRKLLCDEPDLEISSASNRGLYCLPTSHKKVAWRIWVKRAHRSSTDKKDALIHVSLQLNIFDSIVSLLAIINWITAKPFLKP